MKVPDESAFIEARVTAHKVLAEHFKRDDVQVLSVEFVAYYQLGECLWGWRISCDLPTEPRDDVLLLLEDEIAERLDEIGGVLIVTDWRRPR